MAPYFASGRGSDFIQDLQRQAAQTQAESDASGGPRSVFPVPAGTSTSYPSPTDPKIDTGIQIIADILKQPAIRGLLGRGGGTEPTTEATESDQTKKPEAEGSQLQSFANLGALVLQEFVNKTDRGDFLQRPNITPYQGAAEQMAALGGGDEPYTGETVRPGSSKLGPISGRARGVSSEAPDTTFITPLVWKLYDGRNDSSQQRQTYDGIYGEAIGKGVAPDDLPPKDTTAASVDEPGITPLPYTSAVEEEKARRGVEQEYQNWLKKQQDQNYLAAQDSRAEGFHGRPDAYDPTTPPYDVTVRGEYSKVPYVGGGSLQDLKFHEELYQPHLAGGPPVKAEGVTTQVKPQITQAEGMLVDPDRHIKTNLEEIRAMLQAGQDQVGDLQIPPPRPVDITSGTLEQAQAKLPVTPRPESPGKMAAIMKMFSDPGAQRAIGALLTTAFSKRKGEALEAFSERMDVGAEHRLKQQKLEADIAREEAAVARWEKEQETAASTQAWREETGRISNIQENLHNASLLGKPGTVKNTYDALQIQHPDHKFSPEMLERYVNIETTNEEQQVKYVGPQGIMISKKTYEAKSEDQRKGFVGPMRETEAQSRSAVLGRKLTQEDRIALLNLEGRTPESRRELLNLPEFKATRDSMSAVAINDYILERKMGSGELRLALQELEMSGRKIALQQLPEIKRSPAYTRNIKYRDRLLEDMQYRRKYIDASEAKGVLGEAFDDPAADRYRIELGYVAPPAEEVEARKRGEGEFRDFVAEMTENLNELEKDEAAFRLIKQMKFKLEENPTEKSMEIDKAGTLVTIQDFFKNYEANADGLLEYLNTQDLTKNPILKTMKELLEDKKKGGGRAIIANYYQANIAALGRNK